MNEKATQDGNVANLPAAREQRHPIIVHDDIPVLDTGRFEHMQRIATAMTSTPLVPKHLRGESFEEGRANCFLVVNQAVRWRMDPFALAQHAFVISGKLGYEGKVVAAVVNGHRRLARKLSYAYDGGGDNRRVTVSGTLSGEDAPRTITGTVAEWKTNNENWKKARDQMLAYRGAREWARRHMPEAMLGVFSDDELMEMAETRPMRDVTPPPPKREDYVTAADVQAQAAVAETPRESEDGVAGAGDASAPPLVLLDEYGEEVGTFATPAQFADAWEGQVELCEERGILQALDALREHNEDAIASLGSARESAEAQRIWRRWNAAREKLSAHQQEATDAPAEGASASSEPAASGGPSGDLLDG